MDPYDKMLAAGPPEPPTADVPVSYEVWVEKTRSLSELTDVLGGTAHWAGDATRGHTHRPAAGDTIVEEAESYEAAEDILHNLIKTHLSSVVDLDDDVLIYAEPLEPRETDWDAAAKDQRIEEDWT